MLARLMPLWPFMSPSQTMFLLVVCELNACQLLNSHNVLQCIVSSCFCQDQSGPSMFSLAQHTSIVPAGIPSPTYFCLVTAGIPSET